MDPDTIVDTIDQMRVDRGWPMSVLSKSMGRSKTFWSNIVKAGNGVRGSQSTVRMVNNALEQFGMCLYIGPLPKEVTSENVERSDGS